MLALRCAAIRSTGKEAWLKVRPSYQDFGRLGVSAAKRPLRAAADGGG